MQKTNSAVNATLHGLIWAGNFNGTTLMGRNHATASTYDQGALAVGISSNVVLVSDNHVRVPPSWYSFRIVAIQGLFTNNLTNDRNLVASPSLVKDPNPVIS